MISAGTVRFMNRDPIPASALNDAYINNIKNQLRSMFLGDVYAPGKPITKVSIQTNTIHRESENVLPPNLQGSLLIPLGGVFQEIGSEHENVGGGNQKLG